MMGPTIAHPWYYDYFISISVCGVWGAMVGVQAVEIKALAATWALEFALEVGVNHAIVKGDLEVVVKALATEEFSLASHGLVLKDSVYFSS